MGEIRRMLDTMRRCDAAFSWRAVGGSLIGHGFFLLLSFLD